MPNQIDGFLGVSSFSLTFWFFKEIEKENGVRFPVLFISGKCKRFPRHLLFLLWFSWRFKIAEVNGNRAEQGSIYFCKHLHDKLLWPIGGVECVYTSQLNGTGIYEPCPANQN